MRSEKTDAILVDYSYSLITKLIQVQCQLTKRIWETINVDSHAAVQSTSMYENA